LQQWAAVEFQGQQEMSQKQRDRFLQQLLMLEDAEDDVSDGNSTDTNSTDSEIVVPPQENTVPMLTVQVSYTKNNGDQRTQTAEIPLREEETVYATYFGGLPTSELVMVSAVAVGAEGAWGRFVAGNDSNMHLTLKPIGEPSPRNLDFSSGTTKGWELEGPESSFSVHPHKESTGPDNIFAREVDNELDEFRLLMEEDRLLLEGNETETFDLWLTTADSGDVSAKHIFYVPTDAAVAIRYRMISEAIQKGGYVTPYENNDDFRLMITSTGSADHYIKQDSIMGLGMENFDFKTGSTGWMEGGVLYASGDVKVEVVLGKDQDGNSEFKSHLVIDLIEVREDS
jgi:hypothetical protein